MAEMDRDGDAYERCNPVHVAEAENLYWHMSSHVG